MRIRQREVGAALVTMGANFLPLNAKVAIKDIRDGLSLRSSFSMPRAEIEEHRIAYLAWYASKRDFKKIAENRTKSHNKSLHFERGAKEFAWYEAGRNSCRIAPNVAVPERILRGQGKKFAWCEGGRETRAISRNLAQSESILRGRADKFDWNESNRIFGEISRKLATPERILRGWRTLLRRVTFISLLSTRAGEGGTRRAEGTSLL